MASLEDEEELFLARARRHLSPTPADVARMKAAALALDASPFLVRGATVMPRAVPVPSRNLKPTTRMVRLLPAALAALALSLGAAGVAYRVGVERGKREMVEVPPLPAPGVAQSMIAVLPLPEEAHEESPFSISARVVARGPAAAPSTHGALDDELAMLKKVERALREQRPRDALDLLNEFERSSPKGRLREERAAARVLALCDLRPAAEARPLALDFAKRYPGSVYEPRVVKGCGGPLSAARGRW